MQASSPIHKQIQKNIAHRNFDDGVVITKIPLYMTIKVYIKGLQTNLIENWKLHVPKIIEKYFINDFGNMSLIKFNVECNSRI